MLEQGSQNFDKIRPLLVDFSSKTIFIASLIQSLWQYQGVGTGLKLAQKGSVISEATLYSVDQLDTEPFPNKSKIMSIAHKFFQYCQN